MSSARLPLCFVTGVLLTACAGCSRPLQINVPRGYTGKVVVLCERYANDALTIQVGPDGTAPRAACPRSRTRLNILRDGQPVQPVSEPHWTTTADGIVLEVDFEVR